MADLPEPDDQDQSEVFDEDNTNIDELRTGGPDLEALEELPEVYDATSAVGDDDDDEALIAEEMSDAEIVAAERESNQDDADIEDDNLFRRGAQAYLAQPASGLGRGGSDEVELVYAGDLSNAQGAAASARDMESDVLSDRDLEELDYKEKTIVKPEERTFNQAGEKPAKNPDADHDIAKAREANDDVNAHQEELLDEGVEETFPASDPVSVKRIT